MRRALVLAGGGAKGSFQVGMLRELVVSRGLDFAIIRGVSVGALNAAFLAQAATAGNSLAGLRRRVQDLERIWTEQIQGNHSVYGPRAGFVGLAAGADSLYSLAPLRRLIKEHLSLPELRKSGRDFAVGTVSLASGRYHEWRPRDPYFIDKLIASASIPVVFPFVDLRRAKDVLVDGGVRNITPLSSAFTAEPDEVYVLLTSRTIRDGEELPASAVPTQTYEEWDDNWLGTAVCGLDVLRRTVEILTDEIYLDDIRGALSWNDMLDAAQALASAATGGDLPEPVAEALGDLQRSLERTGKRFVPIYVLAPHEWYGPRNESTDFSPGLIRRAIEHGREVAADSSLWLWPPT